MVGAEELVAGVTERLEATGAVEVRRFGSHAELTDAVSSGQLPFGVVVEDGALDSLDEGLPLPVTFVYGPPDEVGTLEAVVTQALSAEAMVARVTTQLADASGAPTAQVAPLVETVDDGMLPVDVVTSTTTGEPGSTMNEQDQMAVGMLLLMVFLNTMTAATALISSRKLGISRRMSGTPTTTGVVILGEGAARWFLGMFQGVYIMLATTWLFDVDWGHLPSAIVVLAAFAAVGAGAALLIGAVMSNEAQASGITVLVPLALGALGGSMLPLDLFSSTMRTVAHVTPHAWALDAFAVLTRHGGTVADTLPELGILLGYAVVLLALAAWRLRVTLSRP